MFDDLPDILLRHRRIVGLAAIAIAVATWAVDLAGLVYLCPYCRSQRTVIGLLGLLLLLPNPGHWLVRYLSAVFAVFGLAVGATQHFRGWAKIMSGKFNWGAQWYLNSWMLSGFAILIIVALLLLIWRWRKSEPTPSV
ncbi:hypothetical protein [Phenylobacterium sp.]|uniref:hypothetical protein n=1 Tax=Phenylobacterium sp. TaxID=1871053 RepID=UPI0027367960|nr:hypothetical protein [Phenylobacterium sp.]MDP3594325.1 hypothetical protein [Phenylobacterium sp.]